jgi:hypothetical protein
MTYRPYVWTAIGMLSIVLWAAGCAVGAAVSHNRLSALTDLQFAVCPFVFGTKEEQERAAQDPRVQAVWAWFERFARHCEASKRLTVRAHPPPEPE